MLESEIIPIFPLGLVLFPEMQLPLHIFEEKYKEMIAFCLENQSNFGVVYFDGEEMAEFGCSAEINEILERFPDGRLSILTQGKKRFYIEEIISTEPYFSALVTYYDDFAFSDDSETELARQEISDLLDEIIFLHGVGEDNISANELEPEFLSFIMASSDAFSPEEKQHFLELRDTRERLEKGVKKLHLVIESIKNSENINKIIRGNGHLLS